MHNFLVLRDLGSVRLQFSPPPLLCVSGGLRRQLRLLLSNPPLPLDFLSLLVVRRTVDHVAHYVDSFVVTHFQVFPVLALGGQGGRAELTEELDDFSVFLDVLLKCTW